MGAFLFVFQNLPGLDGLAPFPPLDDPQVGRLEDHDLAMTVHFHMDHSAQACPHDCPLRQRPRLKAVPKQEFDSIPGLERDGHLTLSLLPGNQAAILANVPHRLSPARSHGSYGVALFVSRPSKGPFIENKIGVIEFANEKVA